MWNSECASQRERKCGRAQKCRRALGMAPGFGSTFLPTPACARWHLGAWPTPHCAREVQQRIATRGRALIGIAERVQMLDLLLGRVWIKTTSFAPRITRDLTLRQTIQLRCTICSFVFQMRLRRPGAACDQVARFPRWRPNYPRRPPSPLTRRRRHRDRCG